MRRFIFNALPNDVVNDFEDLPYVITIMSPTYGFKEQRKLLRTWTQQHHRDAMGDEKLKIAVLGPLGTYTHEASIFTKAS